MVRFVFLFFLFLKLNFMRGAFFFCCVFHPISSVENSRLHSTYLNYSSFYGMVGFLIRVTDFPPVYLPVYMTTPLQEITRLNT